MGARSANKVGAKVRKLLGNTTIKILKSKKKLIFDYMPQKILKGIKYNVNFE